MDALDSERATVALDAAAAGADVAAGYFGEDVAVETKSDETDLVTRADREAQEAVVDRIRETFPDDAVVGEEGDELKVVPDSGAAWVVDPVDGTSNFVRELPVWATSVAAVVDGDPVAAANVLPAMGDAYAADGTGAYRDGERAAVSDTDDPAACTVAPTFWWDGDRNGTFVASTDAAVRRFGDLRHYGCAQGALSLVAAGGLDGAFTTLRANPWDAVAGAHLVRRAGGRVTDLAGDPWRHDGDGLVASNGRVHAEVLAAARAAADAE